MKMLNRSKTAFWITVIVFYLDLVSSNYTNSTINAAKMLSDDFRSFEQIGERFSGRNGRLISFDTKNDDLQVQLSIIIVRFI